MFRRSPPQLLLVILAGSLGLSACKAPLQQTKGYELRDGILLTPAQASTLTAPLNVPSAAELPEWRCLPSAPEVPSAPTPPLPLSGQLGLWIAEVDPQTLEIKKAVASNPDKVFPLASSYKQAVLWATLQEYDAGHLKPTDRFDVTRSNQSLGDYPYDGSTVRQLSERMIGQSDNTATDILHRRVGLPRVQHIADSLGLCHTRLMMPTRNWWVMQAGLSETFNKNRDWFNHTRQERERLSSLIDQEASEYRAGTLQVKLDRYFEQHYRAEDDLKVHNLSTPYEFATMIAYQNLHSGLSKKARAWQSAVLSLGFGRRALKANAADNIAVFAGKGGNGWRILTYTGYFRTKDHRHLVYTFMQHGCAETYTMPNTKAAFAWINAGIDAVLGPQRPRPQEIVGKTRVKREQ